MTSRRTVFFYSKADSPLMGDLAYALESRGGQTAPWTQSQDLVEVSGVKGVTAAFNADHAFLRTCNGGSAV